MEDRRGKILDAQIKRLEKENQMLKELLAEKELESKMKDGLLKKSLHNGRKKEIVRRFASQGMRVTDAVAIAGIKHSTYYYRSNGRPKGKKATQYTRKEDGKTVANQRVVDEIIEMITPGFHDYGYQIAGKLLRRKGYIINHKKAYRLMKDYHLLHPQMVKEKPTDKVFIKYTVPPLEKPFATATVEADIKYVYVHGENRNSYLLTSLCTFSRFAPVWELAYRMRNSDVIKLVKTLLNILKYQKE